MPPHSLATCEPTPGRNCHCCCCHCCHCHAAAAAAAAAAVFSSLRLFPPTILFFDYGWVNFCRRTFPTRCPVGVLPQAHLSLPHPAVLAVLPPLLPPTAAAAAAAAVPAVPFCVFVCVCVCLCVSLCVCLCVCVSVCTWKDFKGHDDAITCFSTDGHFLFSGDQSPRVSWIGSRRGRTKPFPLKHLPGHPKAFNNVLQKPATQHVPGFGVCRHVGKGHREKIPRVVRRSQVSGERRLKRMGHRCPFWVSLVRTIDWLNAPPVSRVIYVSKRSLTLWVCCFVGTFSNMGAQPEKKTRHP